MSPSFASRRRVLIMGAAGRDFHNFNVAYRDYEGAEVVAFTAAQIPGIEGRLYPSELAGPLYPGGIRIHPEDELEALIASHGVDEVVFSYSDVSHETVMHQASRVLAAGPDFTLLGPSRTALRASVPIVAVCAVRTGSGKSQTTRAVARILRGWGRRVAIVRHPMPYGDLARQAVQRFESFDDLAAADCTIEEREEYEPHLKAGSVVYAGIDYGAILERAQQEAEVILWDGGNNDLPFYVPDVHITVADPLRVGHETRYHPGEANLRSAHVVVINKIDSAEPGAVEELERTVHALNPDAGIVKARSPITIEDGVELEGRRVLVVEDGPTLTHGEMGYGAGVVAARRAGAKLVDPRRWAVGSIKEVYERFPHMEELLPAMGYSERQREELAATINSSDAEVVLIATPIDLRKVIDLDVPAYRAGYELEEVSEPGLAELLERRLLVLRESPQKTGST
ncbi:MAG TPA: cyclic 2,3-diphosphoglycerate synthase [Actinomycetota bacterium]|nr:cyclic 2,3-diphosphoglycerate synthase [Actinomycetota bacterium]